MHTQIDYTYLIWPNLHKVLAITVYFQTVLEKTCFFFVTIGKAKEEIQ